MAHPRSKELRLAYGDASLPLSVPADATVLVGEDPPPCPDPRTRVEEALADPIGSPPLVELVRRRRPRNAVITVSDITRPVPNTLFLPSLLAALERGGLSREDVTIVVGTGMHRESSPAELRALVGDEILGSCRVLDHKAADPGELRAVAGEPPLRVNRRVAEADFKIVTGFIEPHFMAGFSGGRKGVCPALVDLRTIEEFHGYRALASDTAREGVLAGNPCHELALAAARRVGVDFLFNVTIDKGHGLTNVFCGELEAAHLAGCEFLRPYVTREVDEPYDLVLTSGGGAPLDLNYYQSVKGMCMALPALKRGGSLVQVSSCREGLGSPAFNEMLRAYKGDHGRFLRDIAAPGAAFRVDQWEVQMLCRVMERLAGGRFLVFSDGLSEGDRDCLWSELPGGAARPGEGSLAERLQRFVDSYVDRFPGARIAVIPNGPYTMLQGGPRC